MSDPIHLRSGLMEMVLEPDTGLLRYVQVEGVEALRGVYAAVRDRNWKTITPRVQNLEIEQKTDGFTVTFEVSCKQGDIDFDWHGEIIGHGATIIYSMRGRANRTFQKNRIGFCVLHPEDGCAGKRCHVEHVDGSLERSQFPDLISPHQPFKNIRAITHEVMPGVELEVRMEGDVFEMEDQRNWTDASFKTYCTPLDRPFPATIEVGTVIEQKITLALRTNRTTRVETRSPQIIELSIENTLSTTLPKIGLSLPEPNEQLSAAQIERLRGLNLDHLRFDCWPARVDVQKRLQSATDVARAIGAPLEVALFLSNDSERELKALEELLKTVRPNVIRWLALGADRRLPPQVRTELLMTLRPSVGIGTDAYFTELNRNRPPKSDVDFLSYSINPQVHAFDDASLTETLPTQGTTVRSAKAFAGGKDIVVSPVTLKRRFNADATGTSDELANELPESVDPRQRTPFAAAWTLGSIKYLAEAGASSITYYETIGWRGVMERESGSLMPAKFPSQPSEVFPLYRVFLELAEWRDARVIPSRSSRPLAAVGLLLEKDGWRRLLLANFTNANQRVRLLTPGRKDALRELAPYAVTVVDEEIGR